MQSKRIGILPEFVPWGAPKGEVHRGLLDPRQEDKYCWGMNYFLEHTDSKVVFPMHCFEHYKINHHYLNCEDGRRWKNIVRDITGAGQVFEI